MCVCMPRLQGTVWNAFALGMYTNVVVDALRPLQCTGAEEIITVGH